MTMACATTSDPFQDMADGRKGERTPWDLNVRIQNDHYDPVKISAVWEGMDYFLGMVEPGQSRTFRMPAYLLTSRGGPRFLADPEGSAQDQLTAPVDCVRARWVEWRLKRNLHTSRPTVFSP
jgi:hypothetical protein